ncbi:DEP domain-containing mTOR-interacting protein-like isoform X2 [Amblyraja radiata]|uniref:DEP domain-containing mTOR-interacting protein-like isoform X2 n=1 Tax=Amblyraja radiata TaxID=386614 RepID=UPI0014033539|nr:DEP domain-containing mTOR-interacting protein-like isoform X2 [Amblyraja radiata]
MDSLQSSVKKKATEIHYKAEVLITGEQLRLRLHDGKLIKDRRYNLRTYPNCFVAKELMDWLIDHKEAPDRGTAIKLMQKLMDHNIIHHVCDGHSEFKDAKLLYRFRKDDGTFPLSKEVKVFMRGQSLYEKLINSENTIMKLQEENGVKYHRSVSGCDMIDWLMKEGEASSRKEAVELCRRELEHGIIQHVQTNKEIKVVSAVRRSSLTSVVTGTTAFYNAGPSLACEPSVECNPKSVLKRPVTNEELLSPGAPYLKKTLTIVGDAVGWGFVVRGGRPCYVQAVDPGGPAAAAGIKVRQFVVSVNSTQVMQSDYKAVSNIIMTGPRTLVMEVMEMIE